MRKNCPDRQRFQVELENSELSAKRLINGINSVNEGRSPFHHAMHQLLLGYDYTPRTVPKASPPRVATPISDAPGPSERTPAPIQEPTPAPPAKKDDKRKLILNNTKDFDQNTQDLGLLEPNNNLSLYPLPTMLWLHYTYIGCFVELLSLMKRR